MIEINKILIVIPARFASTRFPGKPLALVAGKPMIQQVYENCVQTGIDVVVATDDDRILKAVKGFGGNAVMTSPDHPSGTDRCLEAAQKYASAQAKQIDVVVNVQGDEPFVRTDQILALADCFKNAATDIATLISTVDPGADIEELKDPNKVKVVKAINGKALYFSRALVPYNRNENDAEWLKNHSYFTHVGMYAYRTKVLVAITQLNTSSLENTEKLEQLRWLENGYTIQTAETTYESMGVDTPADLEKVNRMIKQNR